MSNDEVRVDEAVDEALVDFAADVEHNVNNVTARVLKVVYGLGLDAVSELLRATAKFPRPFASEHEGLAVIREEYLELEREAFHGYKPGVTDSEQAEHENRLMWAQRLQTECDQLAAMAMRFRLEIADPAAKAARTRLERLEQNHRDESIRRAAYEVAAAGETDGHPIVHHMAATDDQPSPTSHAMREVHMGSDRES